MSQHDPTPAPAPGPDSDPSTWPLGCALYVFGSVVINTGQIMIRLSHLAEASGQVRTPAAFPPPSAPQTRGLTRSRVVERWGAGTPSGARGCCCLRAAMRSLSPSLHQRDRLSLPPHPTDATAPRATQVNIVGLNLAAQSVPPHPHKPDAIRTNRTHNSSRSLRPLRAFSHGV